MPSIEVKTNTVLQRFFFRVPEKYWHLSGSAKMVVFSELAYPSACLMVRGVEMESMLWRYYGRNVKDCRLRRYMGIPALVGISTGEESQDGLEQKFDAR